MNRARYTNHDIDARDDADMLYDVPCLNAEASRFTLISTSGFHCDAWRSAGTIYRDGETQAVDFILKVSKRDYSSREAQILLRDYRKLRDELEEMIPRAQFIVTTVAGNPGVLVVAEPCPPWFDLANPGNEAEALPLLANRARARDQLARFTRAARRWLDADGKLIDLCGIDNLVLDRNQVVRFLDSFNVFLYTDLLETLAEAGSDLAARVEVAEQRLEYLEGLVAAVHS